MPSDRPQWRFARMTPAQMNENPVTGEFFTSASDLPERLVRESIQNSLDAACTNRNGEREVVRVRFAFSGKQIALPVERAMPYVNGIEEHLNAVADAESGSDAPADTHSVQESAAVYRAAGLFSEPMRTLVIEDFGTRGLVGDIEAIGSHEQNNAFWGFFRQNGNSPKGENEAGSWGLGRWVFPDASGINAFLAVTRREGESNNLMMGLAILKTHSAEDERYPAYGHFAAHDDADDTEWLQMPVDSRTESHFLQQAVDDFRLQRGGESGLSVIIPWHNEELTPSSIAQAVITQYFLPIVLGDLVVEIAHPDQDTFLIDENTISYEIGRMEEREGREEESRASMRAIIDLAQWAYEQDETDGHLHIDAPTRGKQPWSEPEDEATLERLRERYSRNDRLAFMLKVDVQRKHASAAQPVYCCLYIQRDDSLSKGQDYYVRGNLQISGIDRLSEFGARTLLLVHGESELGHLLRDAENPAHTNWSSQRARVIEGWERPGATIEQVTLAPQRVIRALVKPQVDRDRDSLADLFPANMLPASPRGAPSNVPGKGTSTSTPDPEPPTNSLPPPTVLKFARKGFTFSANEDYPLDLLGSRWRVRTAYALARGSNSKAFSQYERGRKDGSPDFVLDEDVSIQANGCSKDRIDGNELELTVESNDFQVAIRGFDEARDVLVIVDPILEITDNENGDD